MSKLLLHLFGDRLHPFATDTSAFSIATGWKGNTFEMQPATATLVTGTQVLLRPKQKGFFVRVLRIWRSATALRKPAARNS